MKVKELIAELGKFDGELTVLAVENDKEAPFNVNLAQSWVLPSRDFRGVVLKSR